MRSLFPKLMPYIGLGLLLITLAGAQARGEERAPNLVLIVADDLGWGDVGFNGRKEWATPHLDRLASRGMVLKRCYAASPVCGPSRAALLTGKYTIHTGVRSNDQDLPEEAVTIADALKGRGHVSAVFGKWQHGRPSKGRKVYVHPMEQGFDEFAGFTDAYDALEKFPAVLWQGRARVPVSAGYIDDFITDRALDFVNRQKTRPFFLYLAYVAPHFTINAPADEIDKHRGKVPERDPTRPVSATYAAMITRLDWNIGRLTRLLEEMRLTQNTLIFFASDNGATFEWGNQGASVALDSNRPLRGQKRTLWEGGIRVPALVCWPGRIKGGAVSDENVHLIDLLPTFVAAAGGTDNPAGHLDGQNLLPRWTGQAPVSERTLFWEWQSEGSDQLAALHGNEKLVVTGGGKPQLYDLETDPAERRDLSAARPQRTRQLQDELKVWLASETRQDHE
jgi:arylsulfatase A-like enzyme